MSIQLQVSLSIFTWEIILLIKKFEVSKLTGGGDSSVVRVPDS